MTAFDDADDGTVRVQMERKLVIGNRQAFKDRILEALERGLLAFVFDFSDCVYIDSPGLGVLVSLSKSIRERGGTLKLVRLNDDLTMLFRLSGLETLFDFDAPEAHGVRRGT